MEKKKKEKKKRKKKKWRLKWPLKSLPVDRPNTNRLERRTLVPITKNICYPINIKEALELEFFLLLFVISGGPSDAVRRSHSISLFAHTRWSLYLLLIPFIQSCGIFLFEEIKSLWKINILWSRGKSMKRKTKEI